MLFELAINYLDYTYSVYSFVVSTRIAFVVFLNEIGRKRLCIN